MFAAARPAEVLIADDEPIARDVLHFYLESLGCRVHAVSNGDDALRMLGEGVDWISLVILDACMPGPPAVELYEKLREISPSVPILFCSGVSPEDPVIRAINEYGYQLLPKPFNRSRLHEAIVRVTGEAETQAAVARYYRTVMG